MNPTEETEATPCHPHDSFTRIQASLLALMWILPRVHHVDTQIRMIPNPDTVPPDHTRVLDRLNNMHATFLEHTAGRLEQIVQDAGDYCNNCDMVDDDDMAVVSPLIEIASRTPDRDDHD